MPFEQRDIENLNQGIEGWSNDNKKDLLSEMDTLNIQHSKNSPNKVPLRQALKQKLRKKFGVIQKVSYTMPRSAIFLHKGVSRGHGKDNPREAKQWYGPVVDRNIDKLGAIVADGEGTMVINALKIK